MRKDGRSSPVCRFTGRQDRSSYKRGFVYKARFSYQIRLFPGMDQSRHDLRPLDAGLISWAGGKDVLGVHGENSKRVEWKDVVESSPDFLNIAACEFGADKAEIEARQLSKLEGWNEIPAVKDGNVFVADGNTYFSMRGPRIVDGLVILASILYPELAGRWNNPYYGKDFMRLGL